jgi:hypothetical protein
MLRCREHSASRLFTKEDLSGIRYSLATIRDVPAFGLYAISKCHPTPKGRPEYLPPVLKCPLYILVSHLIRIRESAILSPASCRLSASSHDVAPVYPEQQSMVWPSDRNEPSKKIPPH